MDTSSLIDLKSPTSKSVNPSKIASPLIPLPNFEQSNTKYFPRLSDVDNNPFDKVLRNVTNKDDPFERAYESAYVVNKAGKEIATIIEEKENISHLISPLQTPVKTKRSKKLAAGPLYIGGAIVSSKSFNDCDVTKTPLPKSVLDLQSTNQDLSVTDFSLQCLSESLLDKFDLDFGESFSVAFNMPLPDSPEEVQDSTPPPPPPPDKYSVSIMNDETGTIPSVVSADENQSNSGISVLNNAFVDNTYTGNNRTTLLSTKSSVSSKNRYSFHSDSLGNGDISNIYPSLSSTKEVSGQCTLDKAFLKNSSIDLSANNNCSSGSSGGGEVQVKCQRRCMSARKPTKYELSLKYLASMPDTPKRQNLNNSFAGFNFTNRANDNQKQSTGYADDSVFLEATNLAHAFSRLANGSDNNLEDENLYELSPPWLEENIDFCDNEDAKNEKESLKISEPSAESKTDKNEKLSASICFETNANDTSDMRNAKDLLHNLTEILKCDGNVVDQRKLGENLLNSLALALNLEKPNLSVQYPVEQEPETTELKIPSAEKVKVKHTAHVQCDTNPVVPKIKTQSVRVSLAPTKFEKTLKVKTEKEKVTAKGPLKAIIPVTNMAKNKRSVAPKVVLGNITPPKCLQVPSAFQIKKTSTPYELKLKAPIAQSTPDSCKPNNEGDKGTPVCKRQFKYSLSPLTRPSSTGDISCNEVNSNKPISPTNTSGPVPIINKQLSPKDTPVSKLKPVSPRAGSVGNVSCLNKLISSIGKKPTIPTVSGLIPLCRRKSSSDIKTNNNSVLNRSYDSQKKPARPTLLKRSSSFQSKASTTVSSPSANSTAVENNTNKKYGAPGSRLKSLSLLKK